MRPLSASICTSVLPTKEIATPLRSARGLGVLDCLRRDRGQIERSRIERERPRLQPRDEEEVVDEREQPLRTTFDDLQIAASLLVERGLDTLVERQLDIANDRGERRAKVVRDERDELVLQLVRFEKLLVLRLELRLGLLGKGSRVAFAHADPLERPEDSGEARDDEYRHDSCERRHHHDIERLAAKVLHQQHRRRGEQRCGEQADAPHADAQARNATRRGELAHRWMERSSGEEHVREHPRHVDRVAGRVRGAGEAGDLVADEERRNGGEQVAERRRSPCGRHEEAEQSRRATRTSIAG